MDPSSRVAPEAHDHPGAAAVVHRGRREDQAFEADLGVHAHEEVQEARAHEEAQEARVPVVGPGDRVHVGRVQVARVQVARAQVGRAQVDLAQVDRALVDLAQAARDHPV